MANVIGGGTGRFLTDETGDPIDGTNRLPVETEQDDAFSSWETWAAFEVVTGTAVALTDGTNGVNDTLTTAKEIVIQTDDANTSYIMVGSSALLVAAAASPADRKGIKLNGGETLILAMSHFTSVWLDAEDSGDGTSNQFVNVAYFK